MSKELMLKVKGLMEQYEDVKDEINQFKAGGSLSILVNLRSEFDETFDQFFDDKELREKYNAWNDEENTLDFDITNDDLLEMLDNEDLKKYIDFLQNYVGELDDELNELKSNELEF